jgi:hypothetical protein
MRRLGYPEVGIPQKQGHGERHIDVICGDYGGDQVSE